MIQTNYIPPSLIPEDLGLGKYALTSELIPENGDTWLQELLASEDLHPFLKSGIVSADAAFKRLFDERKKSEIPWEEIVEPAKEHITFCCHQAMQGGRAYADSYKRDLTKTAQMFDWDITRDIDEMISGMGLPANKKAAALVHEALTNALPPPIHEISQLMTFESAKAIARTVMMNIYVKAALKRWDEDGITRVKRMEIRDRKTCPLCRALNGKEYVISELLGRVYPLTEDTHPLCRGSMAPVISLASYDPKVRKLPLSVDFKSGPSEAKNVPIELRPWLTSFLRKFPDSLSIEFDPTSESSYSWSEGKIKINPDALVDQDVREIILESVAEQKWDSLEANFKEQYLPLISKGLAHPAKSFTDAKELFVNNFIQYRMGQDQDPWSIQWWKKNTG